MRNLFLFVSIFILVSCGESPSSTPTSDLTQSSPPPIADSAQAETERLNLWLDEQWEEQLDFSPEFRTSLGIKVDYDRLDNYTVEAEEEQLEWLRASVATMEGDFDYAALTEDGKLSWDMWSYALERSEAGVPFNGHGYLYGRGGIHSGLPNFLINFHRVDTEEDMNAYLARLREIDRVLGEVLERAQANAAAGVRQPSFGYDFAIDEIGRITSGVPFNTDDDTPNSPLWTDAQAKIDGLLENDMIDEDRALAFRDEARSILEGEVAVAYQTVLAWLQGDMANTSEQAQGVWALPNGEAYYNYRLAQMTTLDLTADEIHQIGLDEVERLLGEMEAIKNEIEFEGSLQEFFAFVRDDPNNYYEDTDEARQVYLDDNYAYLNAINEVLPEYFGRLPKADLEIRRVEAFREQDGAAQHYFPGTPDGSRPGVYYSHMSDMSSLPKHQVEDVLYHEGNPGHHMQIAIQQELTEVPRFRTQYFTTAYVEGWGLYAEWLAKEMGGFEDPMSDFGRLGGEIWRAIRLVVDTGIHAKQWTEEQAVEYFLTNSDSSESSVRSEIKRYFANPGQATAYKIGMMNIQQARANAEAALGDDFNIRAFHDLILGAGALPLPLMHARVDRWIEEVRAN
ncbi:MAG: DUF885 family protein [Pseudomonadales bacterium]|nr:DUF885 family protein [Pseudomonadales bacterium]